MLVELGLVEQRLLEGADPLPAQRDRSVPCLTRQPDGPPT